MLLLPLPLTLLPTGTNNINDVVTNVINATVGAITINNNTVTNTVNVINATVFAVATNNIDVTSVVLIHFLNSLLSV